MTKLTPALAALLSARSPLLLIGGALSLLAGVFLLAGVAWALVALGLLLFAAEWLVP